MESLLINFCAPTLAGIKTGSLFNTAVENVESEVERLNKSLNPMGVFAVVLLKRERTALIYIFRKSKLISDLSRPECAEFMSDLGYWGDVDHIIEVLKRRIADKGDFPHEIGMFLSYPYEDVLGFIENKGRNAILSGYWKVYNNAEQAKKKFFIYKKCTDVYLRLFNEGKPFEKLVVSA